MNELEEQLKALIIEKYGSLNHFCDVIDMPWTTLDSILKRGVKNSSIKNLMKITGELNIDTESLASGILKEKSPESIQTIAAHFDGDEYTEAELDEIKKFAEFVKAKRKE